MAPSPTSPSAPTMPNTAPFMPNTAFMPQMQYQHMRFEPFHMGGAVAGGAAVMGGDSAGAVMGGGSIGSPHVHGAHYGVQHDAMTPTMAPYPLDAFGYAPYGPIGALPMQLVLVHQPHQQQYQPQYQQEYQQEYQQQQPQYLQQYHQFQQEHQQQQLQQQPQQQPHPGRLSQQPGQTPYQPMLMPFQVFSYS